MELDGREAAVVTYRLRMLAVELAERGSFGGALAVPVVVDSRECLQSQGAEGVPLAAGVVSPSAPAVEAGVLVARPRPSGHRSGTGHFRSPGHLGVIC